MPSGTTQLFLFDNGSLVAEATLRLRETASVLGRALGRPVRAASLLHSDKAPAAALGGEPAVLLGAAVREFWRAHPDGGALLLPAFFGPSRALTRSVTRQMEALHARFPRARWRLAPCLVNLKEDLKDFGKTRTGDGDGNGDLIAQALAAEARRVIAAHGLRGREEREGRGRMGAPKILLVDHGSPEPEVTAVREFLGARVREILGGEAAVVGTASMERREGAAYDFNEPLLARALLTPPFDTGDVVVLLQFLAPGRHAGPAGDVARICAEARAQCADLRTFPTEPIGSSPHVVEVLRRRAEALSASPRPQK